MEEDSEKLLSALTEMLDSVEDDDLTLSPFDTLPDTKLLVGPESRNISGVSARWRITLASKFTPVCKEDSVRKWLLYHLVSPL